MARVSIYVPDDLRARMDAAGDAINWSEVARPAFVTAIANHEHRKGPTMSTAIERLRASKAEFVARSADAGKSEGRQAAESLLTFEQLRDISRIDVDALVHGENGDAEAALVQVLDPDRDHSPAEFRDFYFTNEGEDVSDEFVIAFIEAAQEFYEEVKDQL